MRTAAVIPAHNESGRVAAVVRAARAARGVDRVLVVDDGSTDATAAEAAEAGAEVIRLSPNRGKGGAMLEGVMRAQADVVVFLDADLIGLTPELVESLVGPVVRGEADMACGLRDYGPQWNHVQLAIPPITGERAVRSSVLQRVPREDWQGWRIETGLNETCRRVGARVLQVPLEGLAIVPKWHKVGRRQGFLDAARMARDVLGAMASTRARVDFPPSRTFALDAIVPAYNEGARVAPVVATLLACPSVRRVLVVDDGSADDTRERALAAGADVLALSPNRGKGGAMLEALKHTPMPWVAFFDADLVGLTVEQVETMVMEARTGLYGMVCGIIEQHPVPPWSDTYALYGFDLTGQRVIHRSVLERLPAKYWHGYGIEVGLDEACARMGYAQRRILLEGLKITTQREKLGDRAGRFKTVKIMTEALRSASIVRREAW